MTENINLTSKMRLKTNQIYSNSMCLINQKKSNKVFIAQSKGLHIYDTISESFQAVKMSEDGNSGILSCLTRSDDLVFFCFGMKVLACGSNGKILYQTDTYLAVDKIDAIHVFGYQLWLVAGNMVNQFLIGGAQLSNKLSRITPPPAQKIQDINSQMLDVKINHSLLIKNDTEKPFILLLKNNNQIESVDKKDAAVLATESPPTYGYLYPSESNSNKVLVGTMNGEILYLQVQRKKIKKLWSIKQNSKGRVNCIVEVKNGFIIFRDSTIQMWNSNRQFLGREETTEKILSALFLPQQESFFYGTSSGQVIEMFDFQKMMKLSKQRNQVVERSKLIKQIEQLRKIKEELKQKADKLGVPKVTNNNQNIKINTNISLDYVKLCYLIEISCERPIIKLIFKGDILLLEQGEKIHFEGQQNEFNRIYLLRTEEKKLVNFSFKYEERFHSNQKLFCTVFNDQQGKLIATNLYIDLKLLSLHQKIDAKMFDKTNLNVNMLRISGEFKYFQMTAWLSSIFNQFGSPSLQNEYIQLCYESLVTKNKIFIQYKDKQCTFLSQAPTPLNIIKKSVFQKSKQKHLSLNYDTKTNIIGISNLLNKMTPKMKGLQLNKKEYDLLPGLTQLQNQSLSADLRQILCRSEEIKAKHTDSIRQYDQLKKSVKDFFINYRTLNNKEVNDFQIEELSRSLGNFNADKIIKLIQLG